MEGVGGEGEQPTHVELVYFSTPRITVQDVRGRINRRTVYDDSSTKCFVILAFHQVTRNSFSLSSPLCFYLN